MLEELSSEGHCAGERGALVSAAADLLEVDAEVVEAALAREVSDGELVDEARDGESWIYLPALHRSERGAASRLGRLLADGGLPPWGNIDPEKAIPWAEQRVGFALSDSQRAAVACTIRERVTVITGGPGVGKTTIVNAVLHIVRAKGVRARLCAPTGRAAKRLAETTGLEASTVHRLLEFDPTTGGFRHGVDQPLDTDFVVVDEVSMVDVVLANQLFRAVPAHAAMLLVGDADQLPSVGPGSVLAEIIGSERVPTVRLTEIFRQAGSSRIVVNAHRINRGELPEYPRPPGRSEGSGAGSEAAGARAGAGSGSDSGSGSGPGAGAGAGAERRASRASRADPSDFYVIPVRDAEEGRDRLLHVVTERIPRRFGFDPLDDLQVLTPGRRGGLGAAALNAELQSRLNPDSGARVSRFGTTYARGDKVLQTVNDYQKEVFNGDIGRIAAVDLEEQTVTVDFEGRPVAYELSELDELSLAYAITVHKSQGSEFPAVVMPLTTPALHAARTEPRLYRGDAGEAPGGARGRAAGARHRGPALRVGAAPFAARGPAPGRGPGGLRRPVPRAGAGCPVGTAFTRRWERSWERRVLTDACVPPALSFARRGFSPMVNAPGYAGVPPACPVSRAGPWERTSWERGCLARTGGAKAPENESAGGTQAFPGRPATRRAWRKPHRAPASSWCRMDSRQPVATMQLPIYTCCIDGPEHPKPDRRGARRHRLALRLPPCSRRQADR